MAVGAFAAFLLAIGPAQAQFAVGGQKKEDKNAPIVFQADEVQNDDQLGLTVAKGHVEISQGGEVLLADTVSYNQHTDTITASGHVSLLMPTGEVLFSEFMELRDSMNNAFAQNVRMLLADRSRLAANAARRLNGNRTELRRGVYSPCDLCKEDPTKPPAWQFKAREITDDKQNKLVEFHDATMEIDGVPVFYTPYMSEPEPSVKRASGFLMPSFGNSNTVGFHVALPYYFVLDQDKDLTLSPRFTSKAGELLAGQYRQRFSNGMLDAIGSINYSNVGSGSDTATDSKWRGHINASGVWDIDDTYRTGFQIQRVSDQTYLLRFGFGNPLLNAMVSRAYLEGFEPRASTDVNAYVFQPLQPGLGDSTQPIVLPVINRDWQSEPDGWGGTWKLNANVLNIVREVGTQTRRVSLGSEWDKSFRDGIGGQYKFSASVRGDAYSVSDLSPLSNPDLPSAFFPVNGAPPVQHISYDFATGRVFPQLGLTWSYPLARRTEDSTMILEPTAGVYAGPTGGNNHKIPDEDSLGYEFRDSDLFRPDRLAGYDVLDTGQRVDYGLKGGLYYKDGGNYRFLIGQSVRAEANPYLPPASGAAKRVSDVVGRITLSPSSYLDLIYRFRLDKSTLSNRTQEIGLSAGPQNLRLGVNYLLVPPQQQSDVVTNPVTGQTLLYGKREQLTFSVTSKLTQYWSLAGTETINLTNSSNLVNGVATPQSNSSSLYATLAAIYQDECMSFIGSVTQSGIRSGDVTPGVSVLFSVVFKNLGEIGGTVLSVAGNNS
ncbi:MAG TPA: LPS assembly protein LptD [Stellaceae bacterium]|jgi:LPS-assembly protein|nr:LPS assembly protein LptD [Stellaceae bacterium]